MQCFEADVLPLTRASLLNILAMPAVAREYARVRVDQVVTAEKCLDTLPTAVARIFTHGLADRGVRRALAAAHEAHRTTDATSDDFLRSLAVFASTTIGWLDRYGWRALSAGERAALEHFFLRIGDALQLEPVPDSFHDLVLKEAEAYQAYDREGHAKTLGRRIREVLLRDSHWVRLAIQQAALISTLRSEAITNLGLRAPGAMGPHLKRFVLAPPLTPRNGYATATTP